MPLPTGTRLFLAKVLRSHALHGQPEDERDAEAEM